MRPGRRIGTEAQLRRRGNLPGAVFEVVVPALAQAGDALRVDVVTKGVVLLAEFDGEWKADITQADHGDARVAGIQHSSCLCSTGVRP
jgi:hypothetical protein